METVWWMWIAAAVILAAIELLTPGSIFWIFFSVGAIVAGALSAFFPAAGTIVEVLVFVAVSLISLALFRKPIMEWLTRRAPTAPVDSLVGETAISLEEIPSGAVGKAELRGTPWSATNAGNTAIGRSQRCRVERVDGLMLWIRSES